MLRDVVDTLNVPPCDQWHEDPCQMCSLAESFESFSFLDIYRVCWGNSSVRVRLSLLYLVHSSWSPELSLILWTSSAVFQWHFLASVLGCMPTPFCMSPLLHRMLSQCPGYLGSSTLKSVLLRVYSPWSSWPWNEQNNIHSYTHTQPNIHTTHTHHTYTPSYIYIYIYIY